MRWVKYLAAFLLPLFTVLSFLSEGVLVFAPVVYAFVIVPIVEWIIGADPSNAGETEKEWMRKDRVYDFILYLSVPVQIALLFWFVWIMNGAGSPVFVTAGRILTMGLMCGVFGINIAHELGHRTSRFERILSRIMLCTSLYMHFYIEHNRGHHRNVATPLDPASARRGESLYRFWMRTVPGSLRSAWMIVKRERIRKNQHVWSLSNELVQYGLIQFALVAGIAWLAGLSAMCCFLGASLIGILLLETVNYIEHYGLERKKISPHRYEDVEPWHSWNSDFILGRLVLFELTRHSDHHWQPSRHYQLLDSMPNALQLPAGYPAMMLLSMIPPYWFRTMDRRLRNPE